MEMMQAMPMMGVPSNFITIRDAANGFVIETMGRTIVIQGDGSNADIEEMQEVIGKLFLGWRQQSQKQNNSPSF